ncbi:MAG: hypothetical protein V8S95_00625 [Odoribacter sp.]
MEKATGEKFIRMEMGVPGLSPSRIGTEAEIQALQQGVAQFILCWKVIRNYRKKHPPCKTSWI